MTDPIKEQARKIRPMPWDDQIREVYEELYNQLGKTQTYADQGTEIALYPYKMAIAGLFLAQLVSVIVFSLWIKHL